MHITQTTLSYIFLWAVVMCHLILRVVTLRVQSPVQWPNLELFFIPFFPSPLFTAAHFFVMEMGYYIHFSGGPQFFAKSWRK